VNECGSESSTLETDVCVWSYAPVVVLVHATQEEEEEEEEEVLRSRLCHSVASVVCNIMHCG